MSDDHDEVPAKSPVEQAVEHAVEMFVYAPIGLLFEGSSILPQLVEKGRNRVIVARMMGQFAVTQSRSEAETAAERVGRQALDLLARLGQSPNGHPTLGPEPGAAAAAPPPATPAPEVVDGPAGGPPRARAPRPVPTPTPRSWSTSIRPPSPSPTTTACRRRTS